MFIYPATWNRYVTWITAHIDEAKIVADRGDLSVPMQYVEKHDGISYGGWARASEVAQVKARTTGRNCYVLPVIAGHAGNGGMITELVSGQICFGVSPENRRVRVPRFTN